MDIINLYENVNPFKFTEYVENLRWIEIPEKRKDVAIYKCEQANHVFEVIIPLDRENKDYRFAMYKAVKTVLSVEDLNADDMICCISNIKDKPDTIFYSDNLVVKITQKMLDKLEEELYDIKINFLKAEIELMKQKIENEYIKQKFWEAKHKIHKG